MTACGKVDGFAHRGHAGVDSADGRDTGDKSGRMNCELYDFCNLLDMISFQKRKAGTRETWKLFPREQLTASWIMHTHAYVQVSVSLDVPEMSFTKI